MTISTPYNFIPAFAGSVLLGKEGATTPATAATAFTAIPTMPLQVSNKVTPLPDEAQRGSNVKTYAMQLGSRHAEITFPEAPAYGDTLGLPLMGLLGDLTTTGTAGTPTWTTSGAIVPGAGPITVTSGSSAVAGTFIQIATTTTAEVVKVGTGSSATSIVIDASTPVRFNHLTGITITTVTAPFTHVFSNINPGSSTGNPSAHPPTYTTLHRNLIAGSGNFNADQYLYTNFTGVKLQAKRDGYFVWDGKATALSRTYPASDYPPSFSNVQGLPYWKSNISLAASPVYNILELSVDISREPDIINPANGQQDPYAIGAGPLMAKFDFDTDAVTSDAVLNYLLSNTQPSLSWSLTNGLSGANLWSFAMSASLAAVTESDLTVQKTQWGYKVAGELMAATSNAGNSGGYSPLQITLTNAIPTF